MVHLWIHILLEAKKFPYEYDWGGEMITLQPGQFITGRKKLSNETGIHESKIQRVLKVFENRTMIEQQTKRHSRMITVLNWEQYQECEQQSNNQRTTSEQPANTNRESKKDRKIDITKPDDVSEQTWTDFISHRRNKKAPVTETAMKRIKKEAIKADITLEDALSELVARGWTGFKAEWTSKEQTKYSHMTI